MKKTVLRYWDKRHMEEIMSDKTLLGSLLMDGEVARLIEIDMDGTITIGRTRYKLLNWLFRDQRQIPFLEFAYKVSNALAGQVKNRNEDIFDGIADVLKDMHREGHPHENDIRYVVDGLYDTMRLGWNGDSKSTFMTTGHNPTNNVRQQKKKKDVETVFVSHGRVMLNSGEFMGPTITILAPIK